MSIDSPKLSVPDAGRPADPGPIFRLATGYWESAVLLAANELGLFTALEGKALDAGEIADTVEAEPRATEILANACCALGLLAKQDARFSLTPVSAAFLVAGRPGYLGSALRWSRAQYDRWGRLAESVRSGNPAAPTRAHLGEDAVQTREFVLGMHERALGVARGVVGFVDLEGCATVLDVGGGPGTYSMLLAQRYPRLRPTVLDLAPVVAIASELIARSGLTDRVAVRAGDATEGEFGEGCWDAVLFMGVLHQMGPSTIQRMLQGAWCALNASGRVVVCDMMLGADKTQPVFPALFSLQMLLSSREGEVFAVEECARWLTVAGFLDIRSRSLPPPLPYTVIHAEKKAG